MRISLKSSLTAVLLLVGLGLSSPTLGASNISQEIVNVAIEGCVTNPAMVWATPGSASQLCPCFIDNVLDAPLTDAQRIRLLGLVSGQETMRPYYRPLGPEALGEAFKAFGIVQKGCTL